MPFFTYQSIKIHYSTSGKGSAVVLLHGFLENSGMYKQIIPLLSKRRRIIAIDLFGHGKSDCHGYVHTMEEQAKMIRALLKSINVRKAKLVGHSMGGYIALAFADLFPKNTKGICLLNSTAYADSDEKKVNRDRAIKAVKQNHNSFVRLSIPLLFSEENRTLLKKEITQTVKEALKTPQQGIIASLEGMKIRPDRTAVLVDERFKNQLILGEHDSVLPLEIHQQQIQKSTVNLTILAHGHMSHIESYSQFYDSLYSFINL